MVYIYTYNTQLKYCMKCDEQNDVTESSVKSNSNQDCINALQNFPSENKVI